jgi:hypothetical protein
MRDLKIGDMVTLKGSAVCTRLVKNDNSLCVKAKTLPQEVFTVRAVHGRLPTAGPARHDRGGLVQNDTILQSEFTGKVYFTQAQHVESKSILANGFLEAQVRNQSIVDEFHDAFTCATYSFALPKATPDEIADKMLQEINTEEDHETRVERVRELHTFMEASRLL